MSSNIQQGLDNELDTPWYQANRAIAQSRTKNESVKLHERNFDDDSEEIERLYRENTTWSVKYNDLFNHVETLLQQDDDGVYTQPSDAQLRHGYNGKLDAEIIQDLLKRNGTLKRIMDDRGRTIEVLRAQLNARDDRRNSGF